jgi:hypothetical protein
MAKKFEYVMADGSKVDTIEEVRTILGTEVKDNKADLKAAGVSKVAVADTPAISEMSYPEVGTVADEKALKKVYKKLSDAQLDEWLAIEGLTDKVKLCDHDAINRMRKCMAITALHFPKAPSSGKSSKSKYADYTTEQLCQMAIDNDVEVKDDKGDVRILRMYTIMALKAAGVLE